MGSGPLVKPGAALGTKTLGLLSSPPAAFAHPSALLPSSRGSTGREKNDNKLPPSAASRPNAFLRLSSGSKDQLLDNQAQEEQRREMLETVKQLTGGLESDRNSTEAEKSKAREAGEASHHSSCRGRGCAGELPVLLGGRQRGELA